MRTTEPKEALTAVSRANQKHHGSVVINSYGLAKGLYINSTIK